MKDFLEFLGTVVACILLFALVFGLIFGTCYVISALQCNTLQKLNPTYHYQMQGWGGCMVQTPNGYWVSYDKYTPIEIVPSEK